MGLLNKWFKKKEKDQLEAVEKQEQEPGVVKVESNGADNTVAKKVVKAESKIKAGSQSGKAYEILVRPIVSEKAAKHESSGIYSFIVNNNTNKIEIEKAIFQVYGVKPKKISIMNMAGKQVRFGRQSGRRSDWKKAVVYLSKGQNINIHEGV